MITFDIQFNDKIFLEQIRLVYKLLFNNSLKRIRNLGVFGFVLLTLGIIAGTDDKEYSNPFTIIGIVLISISLLIAFISFIIVRRASNTNSSSLKETLGNKFDGHYEFSENGIKYSDKINISEIKWEEVKGYSIINDNIFILRSKSIDSSIVIGKIEITEEIYEKVIELLKSKVAYVETKDLT
jgi:hypothetical protein